MSIIILNLLKHLNVLWWELNVINIWKYLATCLVHSKCSKKYDSNRLLFFIPDHKIYHDHHNFKLFEISWPMDLNYFQLPTYNVFLKSLRGKRSGSAKSQNTSHTFNLILTFPSKCFHLHEQAAGCHPPATPDAHGPPDPKKALKEDECWLITCP